MSSYIVDNKTLNRIVSFISNNTGKYRSGMYENMFTKILNKYKYHTDIGGFEKLLLNDLLSLNIRGTNIRYQDNNRIPPEDFDKFNYVFAWNEVSDVQALKSMECLRYQCSEGNNDKQKLYKMLNELIDLLKSKIVSGLEAYNQADWG